jgi:NAD(P)-dependent dehydrogenase (short-subunit alcohol dehydrogenase family)/acyl-CoA thioesterase FadM
MTPAAEKMAKTIMLPSELLNPKMQVYSSLDGQEVLSGHDLPGHFIHQITAQVHFSAMVESIAESSDILIEVGPGRVLSGLVNHGARQDHSVCMPVESSPFETLDLNQLLARLFVSGTEINWDNLYANRLVHPFVSADKKCFFINPCEKQLAVKIDDRPATQIPAPAREDTLLSKMAGLSHDTLNEYLHRRGAFLAEVIKADLKHRPAGSWPGNQESSPEIQTETEVSPPEKADLAKSFRGEHFYSMLEKATGFPRNTLTSDLRLLDDLNLDSIKSGDLIAGYAQNLGLAGQVDPAELANASIQEIIDFFDRLREGLAEGGIEPNRLDHRDVLQALVQQIAWSTGAPEAEISVDEPVGHQFGLDVERLEDLLQAVSDQFHLNLNIDLPPLIELGLNQIAAIIARVANTASSAIDAAAVDLTHSWVREFKVSLVEVEPAPLPASFGKRNEDKWSNANVLIFGPESQDGICQALGEQLVEKGAGVLRIAYDSDGSIDFSEGFDKFSHFIVVLPRWRREATPAEDDMKSIIVRLACAALPPPACSGRRRHTCLSFIQFGGGFFGTDSGTAGLHQCCTSALAKSVHLERQDLKVRVIDFESKLAEKVIAEKAIQEMQGPAKFAEVGYDRMLIRRTVRIKLLQPVDYCSDNIAWSTDDVILVTGGAKGITSECALAVARTTGARMALIGRTQMSGLKKDALDEGNSDGVLERFKGLGLEARYYSCDVCEKDALQETLKQIRRDMGPITGVIHGAGLNIPRRIAQVAPGDALREVSPKVIGALNILAELKQNPPKLVVGLTSVIGVSGMPGNSWYAFSNEALDLILRRFGSDHPQTRTLSVAYSIWRDTGMGAKLGSVEALKRKGIDAIPNEEGIQRFVRLFRHDPGTHQVIISARMAPLDTLPMQPPQPVEGARFLERLIYHTPGVESAFTAHLSHAQDLYLKDHCFNGSYLFPTVFGLEAMAQVAAHVTGYKEFHSIRVEDLKLQRPITVDTENGAHIVVYARIQERLTKEDPISIKAGIFKPAVDVKSDYFSATFVVGPTENTAVHPLASRNEPLDIWPADLYRHRLLFQGPRFQRIDRIYQLERQGDRSGTVLLSTTTADTNPGELAFANSEQRRLMLGDPFQRDALLQSAALLIPQDTSLPVSVKQWDIYQSSQHPSKPHGLHIQSRLVTQKGQDVLTDVKLVDDTGELVEKLGGYRLRILQHHSDYPTVADLLQPDDHDTAELQKHLTRLAFDFNLKLPQVCVGFLPGIHDLPREARRERERPLLQRVVRKMAGDGPHLHLRYEIGWQTSGKPVVTSPDAFLEASVAHDRRYCIVAAADYPLGCDIERVTHRSYEQWVAILGPAYKPLIDEHMDDDTLDQHCTGLWAAKEVLQKMDVQNVQNINIEKRTENGTLLRCVTDEGQIKIIAFPVLLTRGLKRVIAVSAMNLESHVRLSTDELPGVDYPGYEALFNRQHYKIIEGGPQGQGIFVHRFPVTFQPAGQLSRHVYFSNYFFWAGMVREASAWPVLKRISNQFATGKWGGVTNYAELKILGEATTHDLVEVWMWASGNGGPHNSVLDLTYDFRKVLPNGRHERLAWLEQQTTWVRIIEKAVVKVEPYPDYYGSFLKDMLPRYDAPNTPQKIPEPLIDLHDYHDESYLYTSPSGPVVEPILHSEFIDTSLEDSNIVGNIYFANYYAWQGRVRDRYFYSLVPECFQGTGDAGELLCLKCRIDHLREGMPFDRIEVRMALKTLQTSRATMYFDYFKVLPDSRLLKLASGEQIVVWVRRDANSNPVPHPFPQAIYQALRKSTAHKPFKVAIG